MVPFYSSVVRALPVRLCLVVLTSTSYQNIYANQRLSVGKIPCLHSDREKQLHGMFTHSFGT
jgi:hypothetical protein